MFIYHLNFRNFVTLEIIEINNSIDLYNLFKEIKN